MLRLTVDCYLGGLKPRVLGVPSDPNDFGHSQAEVTQQGGAQARMVERG